jgi:hypothetical protein
VLTGEPGLLILLSLAVYLTLSLSAALSPGAVSLYYPKATPPLRLRRARGEERQQVKWFVYTVITVVLVFVTSTLIVGAGYLFPIFGLVPVSVAVAVFKYRLDDIDRLINRTLVYGLLTALLVGVYAGLVFLFGRLLDPATGDSALAVAAST